MHKVARAATTIGMLALTAVAPLHVAHADTPNNTTVIGYVYVNDNTAGANTVAAFGRHPDGSLTPLTGSPFTVGGVGGVGLGSEGSIQVSPDGKFLLVVDDTSSQIAVERIQQDGSLQPAGSPVGSNGIMPVSITIHDHTVYVANRGNSTGGANYTGFTLDNSGNLTPIAGSTVAIANGVTANVGQVLFNTDGTRLIGVEVGGAPTTPTTFLIDSFVVRNGLLLAAPGSPFPAQGAGPFGSDFRPNTNQLYVTNAHNGAGLGTVSAFYDGQNGVLSSIGGSPYADLRTAPCWLKVSPNGRIAFAVNTGDATISRFQIGDSGALTLLGSTPFLPLPSGAAIKATDPGFDPTGQYFYVVDGAGYVSAFTVANNGNLGEIASSPIALPAGATPSSLVVTGQSFDNQDE